MRILYLHGWHSKPGGVKPTFLRRQGYEVVDPALPDEDFEASVRIAQEAFDASRPELVVGSSRGGAVALNGDAGRVPLVLIAPAWGRWGGPTTANPGTIVLHAERDEVIPIANSRELLRASGLPDSALVVAGADHNMIDE